jgi:rhodanese-related sulfurtransferase
VADAVGLGASLDYVNELGLPNIAKYEHELLPYATKQLFRINGLRLIGTAREVVGVLSFVCHSGSRGQQACDQFLKAGFSNAINVEGGTLACVAARLPIVRGQKAISPERQVRIAAGRQCLFGCHRN